MAKLAGNNEEFWAEIPGFEGRYFVSSRGVVYSQISRRPLRRSCSDPTQYTQITLTLNGELHHILVHQLVAESFIGPRPTGADVNHRDGNRKNNCVENLEYVSRSENLLHASHVLRSTSGENGASAKLTDAQVKEIRTRVSAGEKQSVLADEFGMSRSSINEIVRFKRYIHVGEPISRGITR